MDHIAKPVGNKKFDQIIKQAGKMLQNQKVDFNNTEIAFAHKSDQQLRKMAFLFRMMNKPWIVNFGSKLGMAAVKMHLPFAKTTVKKTIFEQFCGGTSLLDAQPTIKRLYKYNTLSILDYGAEGKKSEEDFNKSMNEKIRAIEFASQNESVPAIVVKITGLARFGLLETISNDQDLSNEEQAEYNNVLKRVDSICHTALKKEVAVFFDAEESWIQDAIDHLANLMMKRYNKERVTVYNTFQMYRHDRLQYLMDSYELAQREKYLLGAKLVRGAYMNKERERAEEMGYPSPIQPNKAATDDAYNTAIRFCVEHYESIASCNASHNKESAQLQADLIAQKNLPRNHRHLNFSQLIGMSDHLTFNLAQAGYNVAKYMVYGPVESVLPYLVRRAEENSSVTGDMSRELEYIVKELKRRGIE